MARTEIIGYIATAAVVVYLIGMVLKKWTKSPSIDIVKQYQHLKGLPLVFRQGFRVVRNNLWLFLVPFGLFTVGFVLNLPSYYSWLAYYSRLAYAKEIGFKEFLWALFVSPIHRLLPGHYYWPVNVWRLLRGCFNLTPFYGGFGSLIFPLSLLYLLGFKFIRDYIKRLCAPGLEQNLRFVKRTLTVTFFVVLVNWLVGALFCILGTERINQVLQATLGSWTVTALSLVLEAWFLSFIRACVIGFVMVGIYLILTKQEIDERSIVAGILQVFRPLFIFYLGLEIIIVVIKLIIDNIVHGPLLRTFHNFIPAIWMPFIFVPYIIVSEVCNLKAAVRRNFGLWVSYPIAVFGFIVVGVSLAFLLQLIVYTGESFVGRLIEL